MKDFRHLLRKEEHEEFSRVAVTALRNLPIIVGKYRLSIQAGNYYASSPRENGLSPSEYTHWEVGVLKEEGLLRKSDETWSLDALEEFQEYEQGYDQAVYEYVPTEDVQRMFEALLNME